MAEAIYTWEPLELPKMKALNAAIEEVHRAAQLLSLTAKSYLPEREDDSQTNLGWDFENRAFVTRLFSAKKNFRLSLETTELVLAVKDEEGNSMAQCVLEARTKAQATKWLQGKLTWLGLDVEQLNLTPHYELPDHPIEQGAPFSEEQEKELEAWMNMRKNALLVINMVSSCLESKPEVRTWPHHFDSALHWVVAPGKTMNIGFGISDEKLKEPYFYVGPWPQPGLEFHGDLAIGSWYTEGWTGTVLPYSVVNTIPHPEDQFKAVMHFYRQSMESVLRSFGMEDRMPHLP